MTMRTFIRQNRAEIDARIRRYMLTRWPPEYHHQRTPTDYQRELWIANVEDLYQWARACGCKI